MHTGDGEPFSGVQQKTRIFFSHRKKITFFNDSSSNARHDALWRRLLEVRTVLIDDSEIQNVRSTQQKVCFLDAGNEDIEKTSQFDKSKNQSHFHWVAR